MFDGEVTGEGDVGGEIVVSIVGDITAAILSVFPPILLL